MTAPVLICGAGGQLGRELLATHPSHRPCLPMDRAALDITDPDSVASALDDAGAQWVINAAAYTAVDAAESDPEAARQGNTLGPNYLAQANRSMMTQFNSPFPLVLGWQDGKWQGLGQEVLFQTVTMSTKTWEIQKMLYKKLWYRNCRHSNADDRR